VGARTDLPPLGPAAFGPCSRVLIGGVQPDMVGGPPSHSAIKGRWGPGLTVRGSPRRQSPHRYPIPRPDLEKGRCQRREAPPTPATPPDAATENATASLPLHRPSLPARRWRPSTKPRPELRQLRHLMVCNLSTLSLCLSVIPNIYYYNAKYPDLMNIPKTKHDNGTGATVRQEIRSGK
jgi:hypothetical protein